MGLRRQRIVAQPARRRTPPEPQQRREPAKVTDWIQALAALAAAALASWAVLVALDSFRDQQQINRSQLRVNELAENRLEQRYASRVAWWLAGGPEPGVVVIQNRSPVPLRKVRIEYPADSDIRWPWFPIEVSDLAPCVVATVQVPMKHVSRMSIPLAVNFSDPTGHWRRGETGLERLTEPRPAPRGASASEVTVEPAEDCGEGG